jgi:hypothetical protein
MSWSVVRDCPLCGTTGSERARLARESYYFGSFRIPLPPDGVGLMECGQCGLLFKSRVPERAAFARVMGEAATAVWKAKPGVHPALPMMEPYLPKHRFDVLEVGASNGDLLAQLRPRADRLSALDVEAFPSCKEIVTGEYIIGDVDRPLAWSGRPYDVLCAFDVFEHFFDARAAVSNILAMLTPGGRLIVETGDWTTAADDLPGWYYCNLFEHHIFWSRTAFEFACAGHGLQLLSYAVVNHKGRRGMGSVKRLALRGLTALAPIAAFRRIVIRFTDRDPSLFGAPGLHDHAFVVMRR